MSTVIKYEDIIAGDTIRATDRSEGVTVMRTGKVAYRGEGLRTCDHGNIYREGWAGDWSFELLDRPKPPLPTLPGALIIAKNMKYEEKDVVLIHRAQAWETLDGFSVYQSGQIGEWTLAKLVEVEA